MPGTSSAHSSEAFTEGVRVRAVARFLPEESDPVNGPFLFAYRVTIENEGAAPVQLLARHWIVRDAMGETHVVRGPGVVGEQPQLAVGARFEYGSHCPLATAWGTMEGSYLMQREDGSRFQAAVARFVLARDETPSSAPATPLE